MAIWRRGKPEAILHHSDRGNQYTRFSSNSVTLWPHLAAAQATITPLIPPPMTAIRISSSSKSITHVEHTHSIRWAVPARRQADTMLTLTIKANANETTAGLDEGAGLLNTGAL